MSNPTQLLSAEMLATANAIRNVRTTLVRLVAQGQLPEGAWSHVTTVQVIGLDVATALEQLADAPTQRTPTHLDERR